ncbi:MAG: TIGR02285 family protein [Rhodospirillales bacterium]
MFLAVQTPARAQSGTTINWYKPEFPPLSIVNGPHAGKGYSDRIEAYLIRKLDTYQHKVTVAPFKRTLRDMKKGDNACSVTLLKNREREAFVAFTRPARLLLPNSLIIRASEQSGLAPYMNDAGKVSVEALITDGRLRLGYSDGRSYTRPLDNLIVKHRNRENMIERHGKEGPKGLLSMLVKGHIDAMFAQPVEAQFHGREMGIGDQIAVVSLAEINDYTVGYIGCSRTPWGEEVVARINDILETAVRTEEFRSFYEGFLDTESVKRYRAVYNRYFGL